MITTVTLNASIDKAYYMKKAIEHRKKRAFFRKKKAAHREGE